jgi:hypothetical protein
MKPDNKYMVLVEVAKKIKETNDYPFTYASNLTPIDLNILAEVFKEIDDKLYQKALKITKSPLKGKDLAIDGPTIAQALGITDKRDFNKIGPAQKSALSAIWDNKIQNNPKDIVDFIKANSLTEEYFKPNPVIRDEFSFTDEAGLDENVANIVENFIDHALSFLRLTEKPKIRFVVVREGGMTHGMFVPATEEICVYTKNRALADFLRTLAHELVHFHQRKVGKIELDKQYQDVGGDLEDEANAVGGQIIKSFGKKVKEVYDL